MIYEFPDISAPVRQGDIFVALPRIDISLNHVVVGRAGLSRRYKFKSARSVFDDTLQSLQALLRGQSLRLFCDLLLDAQRHLYAVKSLLGRHCLRFPPESSLDPAESFYQAAVPHRSAEANRDNSRTRDLRQNAASASRSRSSPSFIDSS